MFPPLSSDVAMLAGAGVHLLGNWEGHAGRSRGVQASPPSLPGFPACSSLQADWPSHIKPGRYTPAILPYDTKARARLPW